MCITNCHDDYNYIERAGEVQKLTVEITLEEYRDLIEEKCYSNSAIQQLQKENELLRQENEELKHQNRVFAVCEKKEGHEE